MSISIVNGYVCTSSCDVAKAKKGEDPHPAEGQTPNQPASGERAGDAGRDRAVVFGGSLATSPNGVDPVASTDETAATATSAVNNRVDFLV